MIYSHLLANDTGDLTNSSGIFSDMQIKVIIQPKIAKTFLCRYEYKNEFFVINNNNNNFCLITTLSNY